MRRAGLTAIISSGVLLIVLSIVLGYDLASPAMDLTAYAPNPLANAVAELAAACMLYLLGSLLLAGATRQMRSDSRESSASLVALLAIAAIPVCALLAFRQHWTEMVFMLLAIVLILAPIAIGFRRAA